MILYMNCNVDTIGRYCSRRNEQRFLYAIWRLLLDLLGEQAEKESEEEAGDETGSGGAKDSSTTQVLYLHCLRARSNHFYCELHDDFIKNPL